MKTLLTVILIGLGASMAIDQMTTSTPTPQTASYVSVVCKPDGVGQWRVQAPVTSAWRLPGQLELVTPGLVTIQFRSVVGWSLPFPNTVSLLVREGETVTYTGTYRTLPTPEPTYTPTATPTAIPTQTPYPTYTPYPTSTPRPTYTPYPTPTAVRTGRLHLPSGVMWEWGGRTYKLSGIGIEAEEVTATPRAMP